MYKRDSWVSGAGQPQPSLELGKGVGSRRRDTDAVTWGPQSAAPEAGLVVYSHTSQASAHMFDVPFLTL